MEYTLGLHNNTAITLDDATRRQHVALIGKTGTGKSSLLQNLILSDFERGRGLALIDPHGDLSLAVLDAVPPHRIQDVIYLDPLATDVLCFDPLLRVEPLRRATVAAQIVAVFKHIWIDSWGPRLEYTLTNAIRLLLDNPHATLIDLPRLLTDATFRKRLLRLCGAPHVAAFWTDEFDRYSDRLRTDAIAPIQNKVGQFALNPILRHIIGKPSTINIGAILNNRKILICNLSKAMGEEPSHLIGALVVTAFAQAAEQRASMPEHERQDFTLYVDEFQNFATTSFASILSEARKHRLNLVTANQLLGQLPEPLLNALIGNIGTLVLFRIGSMDSHVLAKEMDVSERTLIDLPNHQARVKLLNEGRPTEPLELMTLPPNPQYSGSLPKVLSRTRARYTRSLDSR